ncbi:MAG: hypothetical protein E5W86_00520 [Mesorhizobium sp.]|nr:MAG: hypothetical protein E5W86_00520 [Mesorhizobium sp.]
MFLTDLGLDVTRATYELTGKIVANELRGHLSDVDFVVAVVSQFLSPSVTFELGMAHALGKPILMLGIGEKVPDLASLLDFRGVEFIRVSSLGQLPEIANDIDRFIRLTATLGSLEDDQRNDSPVRSIQDLEWARERLQTVRLIKGARRGFQFEELVADIFRQAGGEVTFTDHQNVEASQREADLVLWLNELAYEVGGPVLVECKIFGGGTGSVVKNLEHTIKKLDRWIGSTSAQLALVVFDHDRPHKPPVLSETPRVLAYAAETLIKLIERGTFVVDVSQRRQRAAFGTRTADGAA